MRSLTLGALLLALPASPVVAAPMPDAHGAPIVFFDIAAPDLGAQAVFYTAVFDWTPDAQGGLTVPVASPLPGNLRVEPSSQGTVTERVLYVGVPDINATLAAVTANGGSLVFGRTVVPGIVILALFNDPAGNRMGLVELGADGKPKVPPAH